GVSCRGRAGNRGGRTNRAPGRPAESRGAGTCVGDVAGERKPPNRVRAGGDAADRGVRSAARGRPVPRDLAMTDAPRAASTRRFTFSAGHRYWVERWSPEENERFFGRLTVPHRSEEHTSELQSRSDLVCRLLLEKKKTTHH